MCWSKEDMCVCIWRDGVWSLRSGVFRVFAESIWFECLVFNMCWRADICKHLRFRKVCDRFLMRMYIYILISFGLEVGMVYIFWVLVKSTIMVCCVFCSSKLFRRCKRLILMMNQANRVCKRSKKMFSFFFCFFESDLELWSGAFRFSMVWIVSIYLEIISHFFNVFVCFFVSDTNV